MQKDIVSQRESVCPVTQPGSTLNPALFNPKAYLITAALYMEH